MMQRLAVEAAQQLTSPVLDMSELQQKLRFVFTLRDWNQSLWGNQIPLNHPWLLEIFQELAKFNAAGPLQFFGYEGSSGAQPQKDVMFGRSPLQALRDIDEVADKNLAVRLLVRGPFGVGVTPYHVDDLAFMYEAMAKAAGAKSVGTNGSGVKGRQVIFKLFEAQNRSREHIATLQALSQLRKTGKYNIGCELAVCYSNGDQFDMAYYREVAEQIINQTIDPELIVGTNLKDMGGILRAHADGKPDAEKLALLLVDIAKKQAEKGHQHYVSVHAHNIGYSDQSNAAAAVAALSQGATINLDVMGDGKQGFSGIPDILKHINDSKWRTQNGLPEFALTNEQMRILGVINEKMAKVSQLYQKYAIRIAELWTPEQLERGNVPSGAVPSYYEMVKLVAPGLAQKLYEKTKAELEQQKLDPDVIAKRLSGQYGDGPKSEKSVKLSEKIMADLAIAVSQSFSMGIHSVTPGALFIAQLTKDVLMAMNKRATGSGGQTLITELLDQQPALDLSKELPPEFQARIVDYIPNIAYMPALDYIRGEMPVKVNPHLLRHAVRQHLVHILPEAYETRTVFKELNATDYAALRNTLSAELLNVPLDRIKQVATSALDGFMKDRQFYNEHGQVIQVDVPQLIKGFVDQHVGQNVLRVDNSTKPFRADAEAYVDMLESENRLRVPRDDAVVALLCSGKTQMGLNAKAMKYCEFPAEQFPHLWLDFIDARTKLETEFITIMKAADDKASKVNGGKQRVLTFDDLLRHNPEAASKIKTEYAINDRMKSSPSWADAATRDLFGLREHLARDAAMYAAYKGQRVEAHAK